VKFNDQIEEKEINDSVILINKFNVKSDKAEQFKDWGDDAINFKKQPRFISAQMHKGIGKSSVFINCAVWESLEHYKEAINKLLFSSKTNNSPLLKYDDSSLVISPHLFRKMGVPGICIE